MALTRKIIPDTGSETEKMLIEQVNRLTATVEAIVAASIGADGDAWADLVDDLDVSDYETLVTPQHVGRRIPTV